MKLLERIIPGLRLRRAVVRLAARLEQAEAHQSRSAALHNKLRADFEHFKKSGAYTKRIDDERERLELTTSNPGLALFDD